MIRMKLILNLFFIGLFISCQSVSTSEKSSTNNKVTKTIEDQIALFKSLGYEFSNGVTKKMILRDVYEITWKEETEKYIEENPYVYLYYCYGGRDAKVEGYNYSNNCIWFDLEFFDPNTQYSWFMERMGDITNGEIVFSEIVIETDAEKYEWISFNVNGIPKKWKLEKTGYIADHFVQRFSYLPNELKTKGRYTYFDNGGQQWVIDYATEKEQTTFKAKTGLNREWLGEGNHFSKPHN